MGKKIMIILLVIVFVVGLGILYYYYPRSISFEFTMEIQKPHEKFDNSQFVGFDYVANKERLIYYLTDYYKQRYPPQQGYDSIFVQNLAEKLDFEKYDYLITYQKQLKALRHSPFLTKTEDGLYFDKKTPLIPTFDTVLTDKVYIYRIKKNNRYRSFGP